MLNGNFLQRQLTDAESELSNLQERRRTLDSQIAEVEEIVSALRAILQKRAVDDLGHTNEEAASEPDGQERLDPDDAMKASRARYGSKKHRVQQAVIEMLTEHGRLHRHQIAEHLRRIGLLGEGKGAVAQLSNHLSLSKELFVSHGNGYWGLRQQEQATEQSP